MKTFIYPRLFAALLLLLSTQVQALNNFFFTYGTNLTTTSTTLSFKYGLSITQPEIPAGMTSSGGRMYGRVYLDGGAAGSYFVGEFHHRYTWNIINAAQYTINLYDPGYVTPSGNVLDFQTITPPSTVNASPTVLMNVPTGCIPNGTYNIRVDIYGAHIQCEFPYNSPANVAIVSNNYNIPLTNNSSLGLSYLNFASTGFIGSGTIGQFTVTGGGTYAASAAITSGSCTANGSVTVAATNGVSPYTLYYRKLGAAGQSNTSVSPVITATNLQAGATYDLAIVDANGCRWEKRITMPVPAPTLTVTPASQTVCKGVCVTFSVSATPGSGYSYNWTRTNAAGGPTQISTANYFCTSVPGLPNQSFTPNTYIVTASNGFCTGSATRVITTNNSCVANDISCCSPPPRQQQLAGEEASGDVYLEVYPNPAQHQLTVAFEGLEHKNMVAEIMDVTGKVLATNAVPDNDSRIDLDVSKLPAGMYVVRLVANGDQLMSRSFIRE